MKTKYLLLLAVTLCSFALPLRGQMMNSQVSPDDIARSMEDNLTWNLQNELLNYYDDHSFIVRANIELYRTRVKPVVSELPDLPTSLLSKNVKKLPGLPAFPEPQQPRPQIQTQSTLSQTIEQFFQESGYRIGKIAVNIMVDSSFTQDDLKFTYKMASIKAGLRVSRGDKVNIERLNFPVKPQVAKQQQPDTAAALAGTNPQSFWDKYESSMIPLLIGLLAIGLMYFALKKSLTSREQPNVTSQERVMTETSARSPMQKKAEEQKAQLENLEQQRSSVIDLLIGAPVAAADVFRNWISFSEESGIERTAIVFKTISPQLLNVIEPHLKIEDSDKIRLVMEEQLPDEIEPSVQAKIFKQFEHDLKIQSLKNSQERKEKDVFGFLHQLTDHQILHLVKSMDHGLGSVIIAQLPAEQGASMLKRMDESTRKKILASISKLEKIPAHIYEQVARKIAQKAQKISQMKYITADSVETVVNLLEQFDESTQQEVFDYLKCSDLNFAERVHSRFIQFADILNLPGDELRDTLRYMDREVIATSLVDIDESDIERIISVLPEKMAEMVRSSLEMKKNIPASEVEQAKRTIVREVRNVTGERKIRNPNDLVNK